VNATEKSLHSLSPDRPRGGRVLLCSSTGSLGYFPGVAPVNRDGLVDDIEPLACEFPSPRGYCAIFIRYFPVCSG